MKQPIRSFVFSVVIVIVILALTTLGLGIIFFLSHHESRAVSQQSADAEFSQLRSRFSSQQPLIDMSLRRPIDDSTTGQSALPLRTFHTVIFDTRGSERLVDITVPYWFGRLFAGRKGQFNWLGQLTFLDDTEFDGESILLSLDQLEQRGPGLIIDYQHPSGGQFMVWVE